MSTGQRGTTMPRLKKNHEAMSFRLDAEVAFRFKAYADKLGQTYTLCLERILTEYLNDKMPDCDAHTCTNPNITSSLEKLRKTDITNS